MMSQAGMSAAHRLLSGVAGSCRRDDGTENPNAENLRTGTPEDARTSERFGFPQTVYLHIQRLSRRIMRGWQQGTS